MSDLSDLAEALTKDLPIAARKVIDKAVEHGWELNPPGMTVVLRLNSPAGDELASPLYVCWAAKRTPTGKIGFSFVSCSTASMVPMRPADVLEYLDDPTVVLETEEELEARHQEWLEKHRPKWDPNLPPEVNLVNQLGPTDGSAAINVEREGSNKKRGGLTAAEIMAKSKARQQLQEQSSRPQNAPRSPVVRPLQVTIPRSKNQTSGGS